MDAVAAPGRRVTVGICVVLVSAKAPMSAARPCASSTRSLASRLTALRLHLSLLGPRADTDGMRKGEGGRRARRWASVPLRRMFGRTDNSVSETLARARAAADAMNRPVRHNPESPDADLRYAAGGFGSPY